MNSTLLVMTTLTNVLTNNTLNTTLYTTENYEYEEREKRFKVK